MTIQLFKNGIDPNILFKYLSSGCKEKNNRYYFDLYAYKKSEFIGQLDVFLDECRPLYFKAKQKYCNGQMTFIRMLTLIRQICRHNNIDYMKHMQYLNAGYEITYSYEISNEWNEMRTDASDAINDTVRDI